MTALDHGHGSAAAGFTGVVLQASYRILERRAVVHLFGRLSDGRTFLLRDDRQTPHFYVRESDRNAPALQAAHAVHATGRVDFRGEPVCRVEVGIPQDAPPLRDALHGAGVDTFEADVRFAMRYLIDRNVRGGCSIHGQPRRGQGVDLVFDNPELCSASVDLVPRVLAFDIETDPAASQLLAISLYAHLGDGALVDEVVIVDPDQRAMPEKAQGVRDAAAALRWFMQRVRDIDPDVLTGWNVIDFDLKVLAQIAQRVGVDLQLGRMGGALRVRPAEGYFGSGSASVPGRLVMDGMDLVRGAFLRFDSMRLDAVAREVLGEGKALIGPADDRLEEILDGYRNDLPRFALYARTDARLVIDILERLDLVRLAMARSALTGMTPDRVAASIASFDFLYLAELGTRGVVAPSVRGESTGASGGGHVLPSTPGRHRLVWVFDFKSLYPSIIRTFNIDPLGFVNPQAPGDLHADLIRITDDAAFRREPAILPELLDRLFPRRAEAKRQGDGVAAQAIKILMNSFYGVLGTPACRFYNPRIANAITHQGRYLLLWSKDWFEARGFDVLYGDTDSLFVAAGAMTPDAARRRAGELAAALNQELEAHIRDRWRLDSRLELEFEKLYDTLLLPQMRHGEGGARKRYVGRRAGAAPQDLEFVGMEVVRRDWTELARRVQRGLYQRLFNDEPVADYLAAVVADLRGGSLDDELTYRRGLRKPVSQYQSGAPPHVVAARKSADPTQRVVRYRYTLAGPEPLDALTHDPDYEHYLQKQLRPIAEPVLAVLDLGFEQVIGDDRQIELF